LVRSNFSFAIALFAPQLVRSLARSPRSKCNRKKF
jgi:hypothetical protein